MMSNHAQLTARDIRGPYAQLLVNLAGENGDEWLVALNRFLKKENPWADSDLTTLVKDLELSVRTANYLLRNQPHVVTVGDLVKLSRRELLSCMVLTTRGVQEIDQVLNTLGLRLSP